MNVHVLNGAGFEPSEAPLRSYDLAHEVAPYAALCSLVKGKRVLDVGCGSEIGVRMLADWGAAEVVAACGTVPARADPPRPSPTAGCVSLRACDLERLDETLGATAPFEVVICSQGLHSVERPGLLLRGLAAYLAPNGVAAVCCNNHALGGACDPASESGLHGYTLEEFRSLTTSFLGEAQQWLVGIPIHGEASYAIDGADPEGSDPDPVELATLLLAARSQRVLSAGNRVRLIGIWGASVEHTGAVAAISAPEMLEPGGSLASLTQRVARLENARRDFLEPELIRLNEALTAATLHRTECLEPEIARLTEKGEALDRQNAMLRLQVAEMQRRVVYYVDQAASQQRRTAGQMEQATGYVEGADGQTEEVAWQKNEVARLVQKVARQEEEAAEQAAQLRARLAVLEQRNELLTRIEASRGYRLLRRYAALYHLPGVGPALRRLRRPGGALLRQIARALG